MKLAIPTCPTCGKPAIGTVDKVIALFEEVSEEAREEEEIEADEFEYCGDTDLENQETITNEAGDSLVTCANSHEWYTHIDD